MSFNKTLKVVYQFNISGVECIEIKEIEEKLEIVEIVEILRHTKFIIIAHLLKVFKGHLFSLGYDPFC